MTEKIKKDLPEGTKQYTPKNIPLATIIKLYKENPNLSSRQIGELAKCSGSNVRTRLRNLKSQLDNSENHKNNKGVIYGFINQIICDTLSTAKIHTPKTERGVNELASALEKIDRIERLEAGKSTNIIDMSPEMKELTDKLFHEMAGKK